MTVHAMIRPLDFTGYNIPIHTQEALGRYIQHGLMPGSFLEATLANDMMRAVGAADGHNIHALYDICNFIYNEIPANAWGSYSKVEDWCESIRIQTRG